MQQNYSKKIEPIQKTSKNTASSVLDASSQSEGLQRKADMANGAVQRLVQRAPADGVFVYYPNISGDRYKNRVPYRPGKICFTPYTRGEIMSAGFSGCFMMVFEFQESNLSVDSSNAPSPIFDTSENNLSPTDFSIPYIAHVATGPQGDAKEALFDAENRHLIQIIKIIKPYRNKEDDKGSVLNVTRNQNNPLTYNQAGLSAVTGSLSLINDSWTAKVYNQEMVLNDGWKKLYMDEFFDRISDEKMVQIPQGCSRINDIPDNWFEGIFITELMKKKPEVFRWEISERTDRRMDDQALEFETQAAKAFIYASVATSKTCRSDIREDAATKLKEIAVQNPKALLYARNQLSSNKDANDLLSRYSPTAK